MYYMDTIIKKINTIIKHIIKKINTTIIHEIDNSKYIKTLKKYKKAFLVPVFLKKRLICDPMRPPSRQ